MSRKSNDPVPVETRLQLVLAVLAHEMTVAEAARRHGVSTAQLPVVRFAGLAGTPERTYRRRLAKLRAGDAPAKGPWPTPAVDAAETPAAKYASDRPAWGHRKIAAIMRAD